MTDKPIYKPELASKVNQLKRLDRHLKKIEMTHTNLKKQVQQEMGEIEYVCDKDALILCTWKHYYNDAIDEKKLKKENPLLVAEIEAFEEKILSYKKPYTYTKITRRFEFK